MTTPLPPVAPAVRAVLRALGRDDLSGARLAGTAGSGRLFFRIGAPPASVILLCSHADDAEYDRFLSISRALRAAGLRVPAVHGSDDAARQVVLEDLGDHLLLDRARAAAGDVVALEGIYRPALEALAEWQRLGTGAIASCPYLCDRALERRALLWESSYFSRRFAREERGVDEARLADPTLRAEFEALAGRVEAHPRVLIHRDCQSQNLMWRDGAYWFIDYQGARPGSAWYDLASLLFDPYVGLPRPLRRRLFEAWRGIAPHPGASAEEAWAALLDAALQRLMQALGAYAFLSRVKGLDWFRPFMAPALASLGETLGERGGLPSLAALVRALGASGG